VSKKKSLKTMMDELESIIKQMEKGDLDLEDMIVLYEKGSKISKQCQKTIENAENKINIIQSRDDNK
tara:strand:- start:405 stop:605 length:201 start_codon:yes stop_codon:yes gene_type:complete